MADRTLPRVALLEPGDADAADAVLCEAFADYPVIRHVLGAVGGDATRRLVHLFTAGRWLRGHPLLGLREPDGRLAAVATLTPPGDHPTPPALVVLADATWRALGDDARARYDEIRAAWRSTGVAGRRWHLNMLGVIGGAQGRGYGDRLLQAARRFAEADPASEGIDLTTESAANLGFYQRRSFRTVAEARVGDALHTWTLVAP